MNTIRDGVWSAAWLRCLVVLLVGSLLLACSSSANEPANTSTGGAGAGGSDSQPQANDVSGRVSYPDGVTPIVGADVSIEVGGKDHSAKSGADGKFLIKKLPAGTHAGVARKGIFSANFTITVVDGQVSDAGTIAIDPSSAKLAAVTGTYDSIQEILDGLRSRFYWHRSPAEAALPLKHLLETVFSHVIVHRFVSLPHESQR